MAEDIKSLTKKNTDLEKRLKVAEAKIRALADNMTGPKEIQKFMDVVAANQTDGEKRGQRLQELAQKENDAVRKAQRKEYEKSEKEHLKEWDKRDKEYARYNEMQLIDARLRTLEVMVTAALSKR